MASFGNEGPAEGAGAVASLNYIKKSVNMIKGLWTTWL